MNSEPPHAPQPEPHKAEPRKVPSGRLLDPTYLRFAGAGLQFALTFLAFGAAGWWLDRQVGCSPWLMIAGIFVGAGGAMYSLVRRLDTAKTKRPPQP